MLTFTFHNTQHKKSPGSFCNLCKFQINTINHKLGSDYMPSKKYSSSYKSVLHNLQNIDFPYNLGQSLWKGSSTTPSSKCGWPLADRVQKTQKTAVPLYTWYKRADRQLLKKYLRNKKEFLIIWEGLVSIMHFSVPSLFLRSFLPLSLGIIPMQFNV